MLSGITATSALTIYIPPAIYAAGNSVEGEVAIDFRQLREENIEEVEVRLRGTSRTMIHRDKTTLHETVRLAHEDTSLWTRGSGVYPSPGSDTLRVPFAFTLPESLPPSFHYSGFGQSGNVRYSLTAVGVRKGVLALNKRHRVPLAVLPRDEPGAALRAEHATHGWKSFIKEDSIRRGLWGDYSKVHVELSLPDIPVLPLFSNIPYTIAITTTTPPQARREQDASNPGKPVFPPVPQSADELEFALHRRVKLRAKFMHASPSGDVAVFLWQKREREDERAGGPAPVESELSEKEWAPVERALVVDSDQDEKRVGSTKGVDTDAKGSGGVRRVCTPTHYLSHIHLFFPYLIILPSLRVSDSVLLAFISVLHVVVLLSSSASLQLYLAFTSALVSPSAPLDFTHSVSVSVFNSLDVDPPHPSPSHRSIADPHACDIVCVCVSPVLPVSSSRRHCASYLLSSSHHHPIIPPSHLKESTSRTPFPRLVSFRCCFIHIRIVSLHDIPARTRSHTCVLAHAHTHCAHAR